MRDPLLDGPLLAAAAHEVVVDVVKALVPGGDALGREVDAAGAESAPELVLLVRAQVLPLHLLLHQSPVVNLVRVSQVSPERLGMIAHLGARPLARLFVALPRLELDVLGVLVTFPVVLAAKLLLAVGKRAPVWALVTLHVFPTRTSAPCHHPADGGILQFASAATELVALGALDLVLSGAGRFERPRRLLARWEFGGAFDCKAVYLQGLQ